MREIQLSLFASALMKNISLYFFLKCFALFLILERFCVGVKFSADVDRLL